MDGGEDGDRGLPRRRRISRSREIRTLFQRGKRSRTPHLDVFDSASPFVFARVGVVVPKHRHNSVARNVVKRRVRELLRTVVLPALDRHSLALDVLVRARREAYDAPFPVLLEELTQWVDRRCSRAV